MSHPLLDQMDRLIELLDKVHNSSIEPVHRVEIEKYLRWAARKVAKTYWASIDVNVTRSLQNAGFTDQA